MARRSGRPTALEAAAGSAGVVRVELGPLSFGAISGLLAGRLTAPLPRRVTRQVFDTSGGNPLFALELGRAVLEHGMPEIAHPYASLCADVGPPTRQEWRQYAAGEPQPTVCG